MGVSEQGMRPLQGQGLQESCDAVQVMAVSPACVPCNQEPGADLTSLLARQPPAPAAASFSTCSSIREWTQEAQNQLRDGADA